MEGYGESVEGADRMDRSNLISMLKGNLEMEVKAESSYEEIMFIVKDKETLEQLAHVLNDTHRHVEAFAKMIKELER